MLFSKHACHWSSIPFIGNVGVASVQQDRFRCLAQNLTRCWVVQEMTHHLPEDGAISVPLLEVKSSWTCTVSMTQRAEDLLIQRASELKTAVMSTASVAPAMKTGHGGDGGGGGWVQGGQ